MKPTPTSQGRDFEKIKCVLLEMAQQRTVESLLELIVSRLRDIEDVALARIWLVDRGDICQQCHFLRECPDQAKCLHLLASAGKSVDHSPQWQGLDGKFRRFPIGVRKVGHIAASGEPVEIADIDVGSHWIADPTWAKSEQIRGFGGAAC